MDWREGFNEGLLDAEALQFLVDYHLGDPIVCGITRQVIASGIGGLSPKQAWLFKNEVVDAWLDRTCARCQEQPEGHELIGFWENAPYCSLCSSRLDKG